MKEFREKRKKEFKKIIKDKAISVIATLFGSVLASLFGVNFFGKLHTALASVFVIITSAFLTLFILLIFFAMSRKQKRVERIIEIKKFIQENFRLSYCALVFVKQR